MLLRSATGDRFELSPVGYQYPYGGPPTGGRDTDANWLLIRGIATRSDGKSSDSRGDRALHRHPVSGTRFAVPSWFPNCCLPHGGDPSPFLRSSPHIVRTWVQNNPDRHKPLRANHAANQGNSRFTAPLDGSINILAMPRAYADGICRNPPFP